MIKYLFLDIDGVLNGLDTMELDYRIKDYSFSRIDYKCLLYFNKLYKELKFPKIILISSWRFSFELLEELKSAFKKFYNEKSDEKEIELYDILDRDYSKRRPQLVKQYIIDHNLKEEECLILDDEYEYEGLIHYKTNQYSGLENKDIINFQSFLDNSNNNDNNKINFKKSFKPVKKSEAQRKKKIGYSIFKAKIQRDKEDKRMRKYNRYKRYE